MEGVCKIEASVPTGLEVGAAEECTEVLGRAPESSRGRLSFHLRSLEELVAVEFKKLKLSGNVCDAHSGGQFEISGQLLGGNRRAS